MGIHFFTTSMPSLLAAPLQLLTTWFVPVQRASRQRRAVAEPQQMVLPFTSEKSGAGCDGAAYAPPGKPGARASLRSGLRIVRVFDSAVSPSCAGRMRISGRMSDVCAELERMSQAHVPSR